VVEGGGGRSQPRVVKRFTAPAPQPVGLDPTTGGCPGRLYQATRLLRNSVGVFGNFPIQIAGKTGTAQKNPNTNQLDQSWWCGYGPVNSAEPPDIVVCALIENGGFGADAAAPAALQVFQQFFHRSLGATGATGVTGPTG
jgi:penicillin-binding protein 2